MAAPSSASPASSTSSASSSATDGASRALPLPTGVGAVSSLATNPKYKGLLDKFVGRLPERVGTMSRLMEEQNLVELERAVHQLKGAGHGYGFAAITELAARAEQQIRANAELDDIKAEVDGLLNLIRAVSGYDPAREAAAVAAPASVNEHAAA
jgi:HPt (histidine-containing phosphotransfer) domain-containing protein